jgi:hypothetical protein
VAVGSSPGNDIDASGRNLPSLESGGGRRESIIGDGESITSQAVVAVDALVTRLRSDVDSVTRRFSRSTATRRRS